jgi:hypothetical protein
MKGDEMSVLTAERVERVFLESLFKDPVPEDVMDKAVVVKGIMMKVGFDPERLEQHRAEIEEMLGELPDSFKPQGGGGMSFLNACDDKHGHQWGEHRNMEQLFMLGMGIGKVKLLTARNLWAVFPGGMPYYLVDVDVACITQNVVQ